MCLTKNKDYPRPLNSRMSRLRKSIVHNRVRYGRIQIAPSSPVPLCWSKTFLTMKAALKDAYSACLLQNERNIVRVRVGMDRNWTFFQDGLYFRQILSVRVHFHAANQLHTTNCLHIHSYIHKGNQGNCKRPVS